MSRPSPLAQAAMLGLVLLLTPLPALAYLPPAFYIYSRIAEPRGKSPVNSVVLSVSRPQPGNTEESLGTYTLQNWKAVESGWPALSLLFASDANSLVEAVTAFGLAVAKETDLLRVGREQLHALKDPPHPFYRIDRTMSLRRSRQTYAWVHSSKGGARSVWVEKDTFLPMKIAGPCPSGVEALTWAKAGDNQCEVEFRNLPALRRGNPQNTRLTLWKDGVPLLFFTFEKAGAARSAQAVNDARLPSEVKEVADSILH